MLLLIILLFSCSTSLSIIHLWAHSHLQYISLATEAFICLAIQLFYETPYQSLSLIMLFSPLKYCASVGQLCFRNREKAFSSITSTTPYIGRSCFCCGWVECTIWKGFSYTWKTTCELALVSWLSSIWTILQYFPHQSNAPGCCFGNFNVVLCLFCINLLVSFS